MFKKILYPTDFSDVSKKAVKYIRQMKEGGAQTVIVLHVIEQRGMEAVEQYSPGNFLEIKQKITDDVNMEMNAMAAELEQIGLEVKTRIETGIPVLAILKAEEEEDASVIVIGSHGKSNLEEIFLGSVSEKVARKCKRPILIVKR
jgi:nucleotide-binding universal stress UspA family protein